MWTCTLRKTKTPGIRLSDLKVQIQFVSPLDMHASGHHIYGDVEGDATGGRCDTCGQAHSVLSSDELHLQSSHCVVLILFGQTVQVPNKNDGGIVTIPN